MTDWSRLIPSLLISTLLFGVSPTVHGQKIADVAPSYDDEGFPLYNVTISNHTDSHIVITKLHVKLLEFTPNGTLSPPNSGKLTPLARWDFEMPFEQGQYSFYPKEPIKIIKDDSGLIRIRLFSIFKGKTVPTHKIGLYRFLFEFKLGNGEFLATEEIQLGKTFLPNKSGQ